MIQSNLIEIIEIDSYEKLKFDSCLPESKLYNNIESLDQVMLHVLNFNIKMFILILTFHQTLIMI